MSERRVRTIAIALACAAVALAATATGIVLRRRTPAIAASLSPGTVARLVPGAFVDASPGIRVHDASLAHELDLDDDDVILSLEGVPIRAPGDLVTAMASVPPAATMLYAEVSRGDVRITARWSIEPKRQTATDPLAGSIHAVDDLHVVIPRRTADAILGDPLAAARSLRFVHGSDGYTVFAIPPGSVADALGLKNGDLIRSINGFEITTPDQALDVYAAMHDASEITVDLVRRGLPMTLQIDVQR